jgi:hypothetical protein
MTRDQSTRIKAGIRQDRVLILSFDPRGFIRVIRVPFLLPELFPER